jgi:hypothetical protein
MYIIHTLCGNHTQNTTHENKPTHQAGVSAVKAGMGKQSLEQTAAVD